MVNKNSIFHVSRVVNYITGLAIFAIVLVLTFSPIPNITTNAAEFESGSSVTIDQVKENLYVSGSQVRVKSTTTKDLVTAGSTVTVDGSVERNLIAAAAQLYINSDFIGGTARIAGGEVILDGVTVSEDLIVAGGNVTIQNSVIKGDLAVSSGNFTLTNTKIEGDGYINYATYSGDNLDNSIAGNLELQENKENTDSERSAKSGAMLIAFGYGFRGQFAIIIATFILILFLGRRNRLSISTIGFNTSMARDFVITVLINIVSTISLFGFVVLALIPFAGTLTLTPAFITLLSIILLLANFANLFLGVYVGNLLKNSFNWKLSTSNSILIGLLLWIILELLAIIPIVGIFFRLIIWVFTMASAGFVLRNMYNALGNHLKPYPKNTDIANTTPAKIITIKG